MLGCPQRPVVGHHVVAFQGEAWCRLPCVRCRVLRPYPVRTELCRTLGRLLFVLLEPCGLSAKCGPATGQLMISYTPSVSGDLAAALTAIRRGVLHYVPLCGLQKRHEFSAFPFGTPRSSSVPRTRLMKACHSLSFIPRPA